jgi:hypothetical protein
MAIVSYWKASLVDETANNKLLLKSISSPLVSSFT